MRRTITEHIIDQSTGKDWFKIHFEVIMAVDVTFEEWHEINHRIEDLIIEVKERNAQKEYDNK